MTNVVQNLLAQLFTNEGEIKIEQAREFVKVPEGANDHQIVQSTYLALSQLKLPEEFIIENFHEFNMYTLICEGHITNQIAELYHEELADMIIQSVVNNDSDMLELAAKILLEESGLTEVTRGLIAYDALKYQYQAYHETADEVFSNANDNEYDLASGMQSFDMVIRIYDTLFNWFWEELSILCKSGVRVNDALLGYAKLILHAKTGYALSEEDLVELTDDDYLQAISYCDTIEAVDKIINLFNKMK